MVRLHCPYRTATTRLQMEIFSSETGEWCNLFVESPWELNPFNSMSKDAGVFPCNGMLYLVNTNKDFIKGFLIYHPFNDIGHLRYINLPVEQDFSPKDLIFFGVFCGHLRIIQRTHDRDHPAFFGNGKFDPRRYCFSVYLRITPMLLKLLLLLPQGGSWSFKYEVYFTNIVPERPSLNEILNGIRSDVNFLAFHPNDAELVLLKFGSYIVSCNMHTGDLNMASQIPDGMDDFSNVLPPIFLLGQPSWPTPLPPRPLELE